MVLKTYSPKDLQAILKISKAIFVFVVVVDVTSVLKVLTHRRIITSVVRKLRRYLPFNNFKPKSLFKFVSVQFQSCLFSQGIIHPQAPSPRWSALALLLLINTPINRTFSESLIVPDYCLFLLKSQNINSIQKWKAFCGSGCHCKFKSRPAKNKRKKPIKITFAS